MRRKILNFILAIACIVACAFCAAACDGGVPVERDEYVGVFKFISLHEVYERAGENGEDLKQDFEAGVNGVTEEFIVLKINDDDTFTCEYPGDIIFSGTWSVSKGRLKLNYDSGRGDFYNGVLTDGVLTFNESSIGRRREVKFKKVVEEEPQASLE